MYWLLSTDCVEKVAPAWLAMQWTVKNAAATSNLSPESKYLMHLNVCHVRFSIGHRFSGEESLNS